MRFKNFLNKFRIFLMEKNRGGCCERKSKILRLIGRKKTICYGTIYYIDLAGLKPNLSKYT